MPLRLGLLDAADLLLLGDGLAALGAHLLALRRLGHGVLPLRATRPMSVEEQRSV